MKGRRKGETRGGREREGEGEGYEGGRDGIYI